MKNFMRDFVATPDTIDELGHVNNAVWVQWLQTLATSHWDAAAPAEHKAAYIWVVVRHEIDYLRALGPDQRITGHTWVADRPSGAKFDRHSEFRSAEGRVHLRAKTSWALLDKNTGRPLRVTDAIVAPFLDRGGAKDGWRLMTSADLPAVDRICQRVHVNFPEPVEALANRMALYPQGSFVLERDGKVVGYMLAHPWPRDDPPPKLGAIWGKLPVANSLYLHDVALLPDARGMGAGTDALDRIVALAKTAGMKHIWLTAVDGADSYWASKGFRAAAQDAPYGPGTMVMDYPLEES